MSLKWFCTPRWGAGTRQGGTCWFNMSIWINSIHLIFWANMDQPSFSTYDFLPPIFVWGCTARSSYWMRSIWLTNRTWFVCILSLMDAERQQPEPEQTCTQPGKLENNDNILASEVHLGEKKEKKVNLPFFFFFFPKKCCISLILSYCSIIWVAFNRKMVAFSLQNH